MTQNNQAWNKEPKANFRREPQWIDTTPNTAPLSRPRLSGILEGPEDAISFCEKHFEYLTDSLKEEIHTLNLDSLHRVIDSHQITVGTLNQSLAHPREIFRPAILDAAKAIILVHNHPSGDSTPSEKDLELTERIRKAGKILGIELLDHIVLAREATRSIGS